MHSFGITCKQLEDSLGLTTMQSLTERQRGLLINNARKSADLAAYAQHVKEVDLDVYLKTLAGKYRVDDFTWQPSDEEIYDDRLGALWPACGMKRRDMFLFGEPWDHRGDAENTHAPRYLAHMRASDGTYWEGSRPVTVAEFVRLDRC